MQYKVYNNSYPDTAIKDSYREKLQYFKINDRCFAIHKQDIYNYRESYKMGVSCTNYGSYIFPSIAAILHIDSRLSQRYSEIQDKWIKFLWENDKKDIVKTTALFLDQYYIINN